MVTSTDPRPPLIKVPQEVVLSGSLVPFITWVALERTPIFSVVPEAGPFSGQRVVYLVGPEANRYVLGTHRQSFSNGFGWGPLFPPAIGKGLINSDPPPHRFFRTLLAPVFATGFLDNYVHLAREVIAARTSHWAEAGEVDLPVETRRITFDIAAGALVGLDPGPLLDVLREEFFKLLTPHSSEGPAMRRPRPRSSVPSEFDELLLEIVDARRRQSKAAGATNVLDLLATARDETAGAVSDSDLLGQIKVLLIAGFETTTTLMSWLLYVLATHPDYAARVDEELRAAGGATEQIPNDALVHGLPVLANAIREVGRLYPPVLFLPRVALVEFEYAGYLVPAGTPVFLAIASTHRWPSVFANADAFDPDRFDPPREEDKRHPYALATFGGGPRMCLGAGLATMEARALAAHVLPRYSVTIDPGRHVTQSQGVIQSLPDGIHVRVTRRSSA